MKLEASPLELHAEADLLQKHPEIAAYLNELQRLVGLWALENFGPYSNGTNPRRRPEYALVEEVGEVFRTLHKDAQGIRTDRDWKIETQKEAVDVLFALLDLCVTRGFYLGEAVMVYGPTVLERDWVKFPKNGRTE